MIKLKTAHENAKQAMADTWDGTADPVELIDLLYDAAMTSLRADRYVLVTIEEARTLSNLREAWGCPPQPSDGGQGE